MVAATVCAVAVGAAVAVDRVAVGAARDIAVREIGANFESVEGEPAVTIGGFPFLTQLAAGKLTGITARVDGLTFDGIAVTDVDLDADGVTTSEPYTVDRAVLTATLPVETLQQLIASRADVEVDLSVEQNQLRAGTTLLGLDVAATLVPRVEDGGLRVDVATVSLGGVAIDAADLPDGLGAQLRDLAIPLDGLPDGIELSGVAVRAGGVRITAIGADVVVPAAAVGSAG